MSNKSKGNLEKIILAGIGALAVSVDKSKEMLEELVKKGELTVEQGKMLNEELKHTIKARVSQEESKIAEDSAVPEIIQSLDKLSSEEIAQIKCKLQEIEKKDEGEDEATSD